MDGASAEMHPVAGYRVRSVQTSLEIRVLLPELYYFVNFSTVMKTTGLQRICLYRKWKRFIVFFVSA